jgi:hypothetical protein
LTFMMLTLMIEVATAGDVGRMLAVGYW